MGITGSQLQADDVTHAGLVQRAHGWLRSKKNCRFVVCEQVANGEEIADAIGFKCGNHSYLVECKARSAHP